MNITVPHKAPAVLEREFLTVRAKMLEIAASLDRLDRADGSVSDDLRLEKIRDALAVLMADETGRAERIQFVFSLPYDERWRQTLNMPHPADS